MFQGRLFHWLIALGMKLCLPRVDFFLLSCFFNTIVEGKSGLDIEGSRDLGVEVEGLLVLFGFEDEHQRLESYHLVKIQPSNLQEHHRGRCCPAGLCYNSGCSVLKGLKS